MSSIFWWLVTIASQLLVMVYPGVWIFWFVIHNNIAHWRTTGKRAYWFACMGWPAVGLPILYFRAEIFRVRWEMPWYAVVLAGAAIILAWRFGTQAARVISHPTLIGLAELEPDRNPQPLMQAGVYSKTRNPIYFTHWLIILAAACLSGYAANFVLLALDCVLLPLMILSEEKELKARYGSEFHGFMRRVPRFFPKRLW